MPAMAVKPKMLLPKTCLNLVSCAIVADRTIFTKESTKTNSILSRGARAKHQSCGTLGAKGSHQSQSTSVNSNGTKFGKPNSPPSKQYVSILSKLLLAQGPIFSAGATMGTTHLPTLDLKSKSKSKTETMEMINMFGGGVPNQSTSKASLMNEGDTNCKLAEA
ncbi:hypothetical protein CMV_005302 [Castanea mollissima]|uniref:Uncharacterized protein n=1 Tax=Castanea mollissima TaxID=60419 RepID=A0A8J4RD86_9ROSI|nr:hypothetical protein CMV_005302 [Castanea mollissima]